MLKKVNLCVGKVFPRHSTRFAQKHFKGKSIIAVEIGTLFGDNAENICDNLNVWKIYLIDPYEENKRYLDLEPDKDQEKLTKSEEVAHKKLELNHYWKLNWIKKYSDDALDDIPQADFIYIDGEHSYKQTKKDMINYWDKLKVGGILAGHDITNSHDNHGVAQAFVEFCEEENLKPYISRTDWWVIKGKEK